MDDSHEFTPPGWIARVRFTPLADALHWRWSGRLDPRAVIAGSGLPGPVAGLVDRVVRRTRLWRGEKADVARELCSHFADGLASGRPAEDLVREFGSPKVAARLIRKAKLRNRPAVWQCWRMFWRAVWTMVAISCAVYAVLAIRFYLGRPSITHNYWHDMNAARHVPEADRAWPVYREALLKLGQKDAQWIDPSKLAAGPNSKHWKAAVALLERHKDVIEMVREGSKRAQLGFYIGDPGDAEAGKAPGAEWLIPRNMSLAEDNQDLISALLYGPQYIRELARLLALDARVAAAAGEGNRVMADLTALVSIAEQLFEPRAFLVEQLIGMAFFSVATDTSGRILQQHAGVLSDKQWTALAHRYSAFLQTNPQVDFSAERLSFDDVMQRAFTDNGRGDGRITPAGIALMDSYSDSSLGILKLCDANLTNYSLLGLSAHAIGPGVATLVGSREENERLYNTKLDELIAAHQSPPWQWDRAAIERITKGTFATNGGSMHRFRHRFVQLILPQVEAVFSYIERSVQIRDAAEVAIALELWHRRHGGWPETLAQLVPDLIPAVPPDRIDGKPLRYVMRDGHPVVYSLGADRRDQHGTPTAENPEQAMSFNYGIVDLSTLRAVRPGDWILWPPPKETIEND